MEYSKDGHGLQGKPMTEEERTAYSNALSTEVRKKIPVDKLRGPGFYNPNK